MAYKQKQSSCAKMVDAKGKPSGLMMAGSAYHMESISQEKKNLVNDMPIDGKASAMEMSPYKMHGDPDTPHTDPELTRKEGDAKKSVSTSGNTTTTTTTQRMSGVGAQGGFASGTGYDLDEVVVGLDTNSSSTTNKQKRKARKKEKRNTYSVVGNAIRGINHFSTKHERVRARTRLGQDRLL